MTLTGFLGLSKNKAGKGIKYLISVGGDEIFCQIVQKSVVGKFVKSYIDYKATKKKDMKIGR